MRPGKLRWGGVTFVVTLLLSTAAFADGPDSTDPATDHGVQNWHDLNPAGGEGIAVGEPDPTGTGDATDEPTDDTATDDVPVQNWHDINPAGGDGGDGTVLDTDGGACIDCDMAGTAVIADAPASRPAAARSQTHKHHAATADMAQCLFLHPRAVWVCDWQTGASN